MVDGSILLLLAHLTPASLTEMTSSDLSCISDIFLQESISFFIRQTITEPAAGNILPGELVAVANRGMGGSITIDEKPASPVRASLLLRRKVTFHSLDKVIHKRTRHIANTTVLCLSFLCHTFL